ncbi:MAG TPA: peptide ABC transporter substrate-binding protein [Candidatus Baltobacteraceae bacterium]|jgi:peptide/nickel transport system substrate-binding protein|nr:peptide ABC transporter substrate-binding protein [Candidatus Baltobacteraceae bacterium]
MSCGHARLRNASIIISACVLLAAGCTHTGGRVAERGNPWTIHGVLRIAGRQTPDNLNPLLGTQTVVTDLSMFWAGYLFNWSDANELIPELAVRVPSQRNGDISADGRRITYHLRRGVRWQDGAPFTADDVIYTWQQVLNPHNLAVSRLGYDMITRIDKRDPYTIDVHLKKPFAPFVTTFFSMANHSDCILPRHLLARYPDLNRVGFNSLPVGTGPFRMERYDKGSGVTFVANPLYWRGPPALRRIEYRIIESDNTMLTLLQTHAVDMYYRASESQLPSLVNVPGTRVVISPFTRFADLGLNAANPALADVRVRRALAYAIDRSALVKKVTHNVAVPGTTDQPDFFWAHNPNVERYPYDPKKAAALLDAAGWRGSGVRNKNGQPLRLELVSFTGSSTASGTEVFLQEAWHNIGVDVEIKNFSSAQLYATLGAGGIEQSGKFDLAFENWANGTDPDDSILVRCTMAPPAGWNIYHFCNKDLDMAEDVALSSYDRQTRKKMYDRVQQIMSEQLPIIVLWYQRQLDVVNTDLRNYRPAHAVTPFWNTWEWSI